MSAWFFIGGLFVGSFLNTVVLRLGKGEEISGRSHCPYCQKKLAWFELVPVLSFIFQRGRCRTCREKISFFYPFGELLTGFVFYLIAFSFFHNVEFTVAFLSSQKLWAVLFLASFLFYLSILIVVALFDLRNLLIPENVLLIGAAGALIFSVIFYFTSFANFSFLGGYFKFSWPHNPFVSKMIGALCVGGFFFLLWFFSRGRALGFGDVEVGAFIGLILGLYDAIFALAISFFIGAFISLLLLLFKKKKFKSHLPYAPFLSLGVLVTIVCGKFILENYLKLFGI